MGSIFEVKHTGLGSAAKEVKRHSRVKVPKVSRIVKKVNRKLPEHKEIYIPRKKTKAEIRAKEKQKKENKPQKRKWITNW